MLTDNANIISAERSSTREANGMAALALMAMDLAPDLEKRVGFRKLNILLNRMQMMYLRRANIGFLGI